MPNRKRETGLHTQRRGDSVTVAGKGILTQLFKAEAIDGSLQLMIIYDSPRANVMMGTIQDNI
jgi:hypothetical protein